MSGEKRATWLGAFAAGGVVVFFSLLLLAHNPLVFWNDDYELSILPVCADMARAWQHGELPLLSPYSWVCSNLAGEFQYGVFSAFMNVAIIAVWKFPLVFAQRAAALSIIHLVVLAMGAFLLGRDRELTVANSMLVGIVAALNGWIICWGATDWLGALTAFAWLPWAWWAGERALDPRRSRWRFLWPAPFVYLLITGGFPYTVLMLGLILGWLTVRASLKRRELAITWPLLAGVVLGAGMAAPAWLALLAYVQGSARAAQDPAAHFQWVVPWCAWPALISPAWDVKWPDFASRLVPHTSTELACGLIPLPALLVGFVADGRLLWKKIRWELALLAIVFVATMLPTAGMFRWSFRWLPLFHLVLALCAAEALQLLNSRRNSVGTGRFAVIKGLAFRPCGMALLFVALVINAAALFHLGGPYWHPLSILLLLVALLGLGMEALLPQFFSSWAAPAVAFLALLATYFCIPTNCGVPKYNLGQNLLRPEPLDPRRLYLSFYPPPEESYRSEAKHGFVGQTVRPGSVAMWAGLHFVNGYSPIRPAGAAREFATAIHGEIDPGVTQWLLGYEAQHGGLLERLGVDGIVIAREWDWMAPPQPANEWELVLTDSEGRVFHRRGGPLPPVRVLSSTDNPAQATISKITESRTGVSVSLTVGDKPVSLAFSRPYFPGYRASLNGGALPLSSERNLYPLVQVPAGSTGTLQLVYRPAWLVYGEAIALGCASLWLVSVVAAGRSRLATSG